MTINNKKILVWLAVIACLWLIHLLSAVLTPFIIAFGLAYLGNPLVAKIQNRFEKVSRMWAVTAVFSFIILVIILLLLVVIPVLINQFISLLNHIPAIVEWLQHTVFQVDSIFDKKNLQVDLGVLKETLSGYSGMIAETLRKVISSLGASTLAVIGFFVSLFLIPMLTFYFMRDWELICDRMLALIPRQSEPFVMKFLHDANEMLGGFLRGQFSVMLALGFIYSFGLSVVGIQYGLMIGIIAGLISFIPYLGASTGILLGLGAAWFQYHDIKHLILVGVVFGIGQVLESFVLTPKLVGDKLGMHPLAVVFALMAGGNLFGFFGILLALPACAVLMVLLREIYHRYMNSGFYLNR